MTRWAAFLLIAIVAAWAGVMAIYLVVALVVWLLGTVGVAFTIVILLLAMLLIRCW